MEDNQTGSKMDVSTILNNALRHLDEDEMMTLYKSIGSRLPSTDLKNEAVKLWDSRPVYALLDKEFILDFAIELAQSYSGIVAPKKRDKIISNLPQDIKTCQAISNIMEWNGYVVEFFDNQYLQDESKVCLFNKYLETICIYLDGRIGFQVNDEYEAMPHNADVVKILINNGYIMGNNGN